MIQRAAVYVHLRVPLHHLVLELVDDSILLDLVLLLHGFDLRVNFLIDDAIQALLFDHLVVDE